jgi:hypothetical protein
MLVNTDRTKLLQMTTLSMMRAMRAVFCQLLRYWIIVRSSLGILIRRPEFLKGVLNALVADERTLDAPEDLPYETTAQIGLYANRAQDRSKAC